MLKVNFDGSCEPRNPNGNLGMGYCGLTEDGIPEFVGYKKSKIQRLWL